MSFLGSLHDAANWVADKTSAIPILGTVTGAVKNIGDYGADKKHGRPTSLLHLAHDVVDTAAHTNRYLPGVATVTGWAKNVTDYAANKKNGREDSLINMGLRMAHTANDTTLGFFGENSASRAVKGTIETAETAKKGFDFLGGIMDFLSNNVFALVAALVTVVAAASFGLPALLVGGAAIVGASVFGDKEKGVSAGLADKAKGMLSAPDDLDARRQAQHARENAAQAAGKSDKTKGDKVERPDLPPQLTEQLQLPQR